MSKSNIRTKKFSVLLSLLLLIYLVFRYFEIQQMPVPFGTELILVSIIGSIYSLRFALKKERNLKDFTKWIMILSWMAFEYTLIIGLFDLSIVMIFSVLSTTGWMILEIIPRIQLTNKKVEITDRVNRMLTIGTTLIAFSVYMMFNHMPGKTIVQMSAILLCSIGFYLDYLEQIKRSK